mmetsp:Transcript_26837/g.61894  ORF Transcript_26837/g.61894 Transcript_26837/m.61894 type:complete len:308 (+) Transcript_26837:39-962(+)
MSRVTQHRGAAWRKACCASLVAATWCLVSQSSFIASSHALPRHSAASTGMVGSSMPSKRQLTVHRQGWGDPVDFFDASVYENVEAADGFRSIILEAPSTVLDPYTKPGQFVQAKAVDEEKPSFYAISSPPSSGDKAEFLIKVAPSNDWLVNAKKGDSVLLSAAMGKGFPVDGESWDGAVNQVGIFATGSGIAPIRSMIESGALRGKATRLYYGARSESAMPFQERFSEWTKKDGIEVVPVLSQAGSDWAGRTGYVQDAFQQDEEQGEGFVLSSQHGGILCGQKEMAEDVRKLYESLDVPPERVLTNF